MRWDVGIDLGTDYVRMAEYREGATLEEAARMAFREGGDMPICCGDAAARIDGRACAGVEVCRPMRDGVLESNFYADRMFRWLFERMDFISRRKRFGAMITCAPFARPVQQEALMAAAMDAGAGEAALVRADAAAAIGAGLDLAAPEGKLLVDIGAGKISCTLFTLGRVAAFGYVPYGMNRIDERIQRIVRAESGYRIGMNSAREIKNTLGTALPERAPADVIMHMTGFGMESRMPEAFDVETAPVLRACEEVVGEIAGLCAHVASLAPEELSADLNDAGAVLVGGGAEMPGMDKRIGDTLGIPCRVADAPGKCAVRGLVEIMRSPDRYEAAFMATTRESGRR